MFFKNYGDRSETLGAVGRTVHRLPSLSAFSLRRVLTDQ